MRSLVLWIGIWGGAITQAVAGELRVDLKAPSAAVGGEIAYSVYLPEGHDLAGQRFPVVFLLHGFGGGQREWIDGGSIQATLDRLIDEGIIAPVVAVMPEAGKSWYVNSAAFGGPGDYETAIALDLVTAVDKAYPTDPAKRAIAGNSMGGFGALRLAFLYPETFGAVAALSPGLFIPGGLSWEKGPMAFTPDEQEMWFPKTTGETFDIDTYIAQSPYSLISDVAAMSEAPEVLLTVGDDDYWQLHDGTAEMYLAMREEGLKPELRVSDGGHDWDHWRPMAELVFRFFDGQWKAH